MANDANGGASATIMRADVNAEDHIRAKARPMPIARKSMLLDGQVQILKGLESGARIMVYSKQELSSRSRISIVDHLVDAAP